MKPLGWLFLVSLAYVACQAFSFDSDPTVILDRAIATKYQNTTWKPVLSNYRQVIPNSKLPTNVTLQRANNCVGITMYQDRLFIGFRTAPFHFADPHVEMYVLSSTDMGQSWDFEASISLGYDVREPYFITFNNTLIFSFFEAGKLFYEFQPQKLYRMTRRGLGNWSPIEEWGTPGEIAWQLNVVGNTAFATSYIGDHYSTDASNVKVFFNYTTDGKTWQPFDAANPTVYYGGVSEVGFEFDLDGNVWGVMRNEDGDQTGWGSHISFAPKSNLGNWTTVPTSTSNPDIFESPRMFRHGEDLYLIARRDLEPPYDMGLRNLDFQTQKWIYLTSYSFRAHTTALWRLDTKKQQLIYIMDLPGDGDTAFPSILRIGPHKFLIANYSSPLGHGDWSWIFGQINTEGTQIYFIELEFVPGEIGAI